MPPRWSCICWRGASPGIVLPSLVPAHLDRGRPMAVWRMISIECARRTDATTTGQPDDFAIWAADQIKDDPDAATSVGQFYRRRDFAAYMSHLLDSQAGMSDIHRIQNIADSITAAGGRWRVGLAGGGHLDAAKVVIATGNQSPTARNPPPKIPGLIQPWRGDWADGVDTNAAVTIIGGPTLWMQSTFFIDADMTGRSP